MRCLLLPLVSMVCLAQDASPKSQIAFNKVHHDFGRIPADKKVTYRFKVTNQGKATLNITQLNPSCGCTSTNVGKWSLAPAESTEIEVGFDPSKFFGSVRKSLQVVSDDPLNPNSTLTFEAEVVHEVSLSSSALFFMDVPRSSTKKSSFKVLSGNGKPVQVTDVRIVGSPYLTAVWRQEGNDVAVDMTLDGSKIPPSRVNGVDSVTIQTNNPRFSAIPLSVQWDVKRAITASPERLAWVKSKKETFTDTLTLSSITNKPFRVRGARASSPDIKVTQLPNPDAAGTSHKATVTFVPSRTGYFNEWVIFTLDDPEQPELHIRVSASVQ